MKNIIAAVLFVLASTFLRAQAFAPDNELDTVAGGVFQTALENEAYKKAVTLPDFNSTNIGVSCRSPLTVRFWRALPAGWDEIVFDTLSRSTSASHQSFSGGSKISTAPLLEELKTYSP